jgi:pilus assembly protein Flp/PilA
MWVRFANDETGVTAIEYGLIAAGIAVAALVAIQAVGTSLSGLFNTVSTTVSGAVGGGG